ncbi:carbon monoxide dehydrogenase subunit G [Ferrovibrio sp.]|uniref:SRPBCC family protein n=1 Tax=Ferrovibrio sp. TaxID=1917215 RepID=UPI0035B3A4F3
MDMNGEQLIPAPRAKVWAALNDPDVLRQCITGCETLEKNAEGGFEASVVVKVGPVKAKFKGKVALSDIDPPNGYTISGEAQGGVAAGFGKGGAKVALSDAPEGGTRLTYIVNAQVGGKLAQIGARLIDATAAKMAEEFFTKFNTLVSSAEAPAAHAPGEAPAGAPGAATGAATGEAGAANQAAINPAPVAPQIDAAAPETDAGGLPGWVWIGGLVAVVAIVTVLVLKF